VYPPPQELDSPQPPAGPSNLQVLRTLTAAEAESGCVDVPAALKPPTPAPGQGRAGSKAAAAAGGSAAAKAPPGSPQGGGGDRSGAAAGALPLGDAGEGDDLEEALRSGLCLQEIDTPQAR
jgi:hypothetical protein